MHFSPIANSAAIIAKAQETLVSESAMQKSSYAKHIKKDAQIIKQQEQSAAQFIQTMREVFAKNHLVAYGLGNKVLGVAEQCKEEFVNMAAVQVPTTSEIVCVATGEYHSVVLDAQGYVYGCGGYMGLGMGKQDQGEGFTKHPLFCDIVSIACGSHHTLVLNKAGEAYGFGVNDEGQVVQ